MKYLALVLTLVISACASNIKTSQPVNGVISQLRVIGNGNTIEQAKTNGFTSAIEIAVGAVVLTDVEVKGNTLIRDEIIKHSAGYIDDYKIVSQSYINNQYTLVMDVDVKSSRIMERLLNKGSTSTSLNGDRLSNQYSSYMNERRTGDQVLNRLLSDFPSNAMKITQGQTQFMLDGYRNPVLIVPIEIRWDYKYLTALNEVLSILEDKSGPTPDKVHVISKNPNAWLVGETNVYGFSDGVRFQRIINGLDKEIKIHARIQNSNGGTIFTGCYNSGQTFRGLNKSNSRYVVWGNDVERDHIRIVFDDELKQKFKNADKVTLSIRESC